MTQVDVVAGADIGAFREAARAWLADRLKPKEADAGISWGTGSDSVAVFHDLSPAEERALLDGAMAWQQEKFDAGYGAIIWPRSVGGLGASVEHERAFRSEEAAFQTPGGHETFSVTVHLVAPTLRAFGTDEQLDLLLRRLLRAEELCCQLFSEPTAGSDLAGLGTRAVRDGNEWVVNGQKVWSSGALFSQWGELIARTDPDVPKHRGLTAFMLPMDTPGVEVRPIRQMSGGSSFCEVFFDDVRIPDSLRLGGVGDGWRVALTTLGFERGGGGGGSSAGGSWAHVRALAEHLGVTGDPLVRQDLAGLYTRHRLLQLTRQRVADLVEEGEAPGPEGSIGKLAWTEHLKATSDVVSRLLGPRLVVDTGEWGTYAWREHVLGAPGYRIAGGSDEVQRNIIGERVLGLPGEPRVDRDVPFRDVPR